MFDQNVFADRLSEQMLLQGYDIKALAKALEVSPSTIYNLKKCRYKQPATDVFFKIVELFQVSADYMLGFVEFPPDGVVYHVPLRTYGAKIRTLLKERNLKQKDIIEDMKISSNLLYKWLSTDTLPTVETLIRLSDYFDMSIDAFTERIQ
ncbi:MAG: transcriptional regulator [Clostridia bacterium]|nr:transcriptional regulator [Clostridia bacterium]